MQFDKEMHDNQNCEYHFCNWKGNYSNSCIKFSLSTIITKYTAM